MPCVNVEREAGRGSPQRLPFAAAPCECVRRHVPAATSIELHHPFPQSFQKKRYGRVVDDTTVPLCPTAHTVVHDALRVRLRGEDYRLGNRYLQGIVEEGLRKIKEAEEG